MRFPTEARWRLVREMILFGIGAPAFYWELSHGRDPFVLGFIGMMLGLPIPLGLDRVAKRRAVESPPQDQR